MVQCSWRVGGAPRVNNIGDAVLQAGGSGAVIEVELDGGGAGVSCHAGSRGVEADPEERDHTVDELQCNVVVGLPDAPGSVQ